MIDNIDNQGQPAGGAAHVIAVRTPDARLVWYTDITARTSKKIAELGVFTAWGGILVRDDYAGWYQFDAHLGGVRQCVAHLIRHLQGVLDLDTHEQFWAAQVQQALRDAARLVAAAKTTDTPINTAAMTHVRYRYDQGVLVGISTNLSRAWDKGNHPGLVLARRLKTKTHQVWLFTTNLKVPPTNNASEQALKSPKPHQKISGYRHTTITPARYCRVRSYLVTARNHDLSAIDAIHAALTGTPWLPTPATS